MYLIPEDRRNFYDDRLHPTADYQAEEWYWPTDEEWKIIEPLTVDYDLMITRYEKKYGHKEMIKCNKYLFDEGGLQVVYWAKNLKTYLGEYENPLTQELLIGMLDNMDSEIVEPWLESYED